MELRLSEFTITLILFVGVLLINDDHVYGSTVTSDQIYWNRVLPDSLMPVAIKSSLRSTGNQIKKSPFRVSTLVRCTVYFNAATEKEVDDYLKEYGETYTLETMMIPGKSITVRLKTHSDNKEMFLTHKEIVSFPFSSNKLPEILKKLSIDPSSKEASTVKHTIKYCEERHDGEDKLCVVSLKDMVSFATSKLGNRVVPISTTSADKAGKIKYTIMGVKKLADYGSHVVVCHKEKYPYAVFMCHRVEMTKAYMVSLVGEGVNVNAVAVCHKDTSWWSPKHLSFQVLKTKPGKTTPICHFLDDLSVVWTKK